MGPLGTAQITERIEGRIPIRLGRSLESARTKGARIELQLRASNGSSEQLTADHAMAATGYRIDLSRLPFINCRLLSQIEMEDTKPLLSLDFETSVPGLHIVGAASAFSFGPVCRFVFGAVHPARAVSRVLARARGSTVGAQRSSTQG